MRWKPRRPQAPKAHRSAIVAQSYDEGIRLLEGVVAMLTKML